MVKKTLAIAFSVTLIFFLWVANSKPLFDGYANTFEIYQKDNSSSAQIIKVEKENLWLYPLRYGEACVVKKEGFDKAEFFLSFNATLIMTEEIDTGVNYYAYSPKVKYCKEINGKKVNLHLFVGEQEVKMGSPLIFGSY